VKSALYSNIIYRQYKTEKNCLVLMNSVFIKITLEEKWDSNSIQERMISQFDVKRSDRSVRIRYTYIINRLNNAELLTTTSLRRLVLLRFFVWQMMSDLFRLL
jgi:hypothetical protein